MTAIVIGVVAMALFSAILLWTVMIYNGLVRLKNNIDKAFSNIDVLLKQRYDEIPNLVEVCKGYMQHERQTLTRVIDARAKAGRGAQDDQRLDIHSNVTDALGRLFMLAENYPDLKADSAFLKLQLRITELEDHIADRREFFNESVNLYNIRIEQFPDVFVAKLFNYGARRLWRAEPEHRVRPAVSGV